MRFCLRQQPARGHLPIRADSIGCLNTRAKRRAKSRMGLGIVLVFWAVVGVFLASAAAATLAGIVYFVDRRAGRVRPRWLLTAIVVPFISLGYTAAGFVVYAVYCETVRDVDLGLGDSLRVPLGYGYRLV